MGRSSNKNSCSGEGEGIHRPFGLTFFAAFFFVLAVVEAIVGLTSLIVLPFQDYVFQLYKGLFYSWVYSHLFGRGGFPLFSLAGFEMEIRSYEYFILLWKVWGWGSPLISGLSVSTGVGLLRLRKWGRYLALAFGAIFTTGGLLLLIFLSPSSAFYWFGWLLLTVGIVSVVYLNSRVKRAFEAVASQKILETKSLNTLISDVRMGGRCAKLDAVLALGEVVGEAAAAALVEALGDEDRKVRVMAAVSLEKIGKPALEPLNQALKNEDAHVREVAALLLGKIGDENSSEPLIRTLTDPAWRVRRAVALALGRVGDGRAIDPLSRALRDNQKKVRDAAKTALVLVGKRHADFRAIVQEKLVDASRRSLLAGVIGGVLGTISMGVGALWSLIFYLFGIDLGKFVVGLVSLVGFLTGRWNPWAFFISGVWYPSVFSPYPSHLELLFFILSVVLGVSLIIHGVLTGLGFNGALRIVGNADMGMLSLITSSIGGSLAGTLIILGDTVVKLNPYAPLMHPPNPIVVPVDFPHPMLLTIGCFVLGLTFMVLGVTTFSIRGLTPLPKAAQTAGILSIISGALLCTVWCLGFSLMVMSMILWTKIFISLKERSQ